MKRSTQVALLLMGAAGVGASAYAFTAGRRDCVPAGTPPTTAAAATDKESRIDPCPPRNSYSSRSGYYRSNWSSSSPTHWWTPIFSRRSQSTATTSNQPSSTSLGFTSRPGGSTTTARPSNAPTNRTGFGSIGRTFSISS